MTTWDSEQHDATDAADFQLGVAKMDLEYEAKRHAEMVRELKEARKALLGAEESLAVQLKVRRVLEDQLHTSKMDLEYEKKKRRGLDIRLATAERLLREARDNREQLREKNKLLKRQFEELQRAWLELLCTKTVPGADAIEELLEEEHQRTIVRLRGILK